jgi:hypothetical protein
MADKDLQGGYYQFRSSKRLLRESDLERGKTELRRMLRDRPEMKRHLSEDDELFQWAAKKFAGEDLPTWIEWQDRWETESEACHMPPDDKSPGWIFVKNIRSSRLQQLANGSQAFDTLWLHAAYELHNIQGHEEFNRLYEKVYAGTITRDEFVLGMARTEYGAWLRLRLFYIEKYYPWARNWGIDTDLVAWGLDTPSTFDEWVSQYPRGYSYPWQYYGEFHDDVTVAKELQGTAVGWGKLKKQAGAAWEQVKTDALLRHRARQLWNQVLRRDSTKSNVTLPINAGVSELP